MKYKGDYRKYRKVHRVGINLYRFKQNQFLILAPIIAKIIYQSSFLS